MLALLYFTDNYTDKAKKGAIEKAPKIQQINLRNSTDKTKKRNKKGAQYTTEIGAQNATEIGAQNTTDKPKKLNG